MTDLEALEASTALRTLFYSERWGFNCSLIFCILCVGPFCQVSLGNGAHTPAATYTSKDREEKKRQRCDCIEVKNPDVMESLK